MNYDHTKHGKLLVDAPRVGGLNVPLGWHSILDRFCEEVKALDLPGCNVTSVSEHYGSLKIEYVGHDFWQDYQWGEMARTVEFYRKLSRHVCQECGTTVDVSYDLRWQSTLCKNCGGKKMAL